MVDQHPVARVPALALMIRRLRLRHTDTSTAAAGRFVRDMCRTWGVPDSLVGEAAWVVRRLVDGVSLDAGAAFELVMEARGGSVWIQLHDRNLDQRGPGATTRRTAPARRGETEPLPGHAWTFGTDQDGERWAAAPRERQPPLPKPSRPSWPGAFG
jgi:hypothetical protein